MGEKCRMLFPNISHQSVPTESKHQGAVPRTRNTSVCKIAFSFSCKVLQELNINFLFFIYFLPCKSCVATMVRFAVSGIYLNAFIL